MDKQIIIDGVDVSGCEHFSVHGCNGCCAYFLENEDTIVDCKKYPNCYYKQLKRKEQECEKLKAELKNFRSMAKKGLDEFKHIGGCWGCGLQLQLNQDIEDIRKLKAENEVLKQYKASKQASYESMQKEWNNAVNENRELKAENERFKVNKHQYCFAYDETCLTGNEKCVYYTCGFKSILKLKQTLAEIKEIAENGKRFAERYMITGEQKANVLTYANAILQKISEVEDEN